MSYYAIAFKYTRPQPELLYFTKAKNSYKPHTTRDLTELKPAGQMMFTATDLSKLSLWLISHPQIFKMLTVITSAGKLAHAKHINKYARGNDLMAVQRCIFLHHFKKAMQIIPNKYHINVIQGLKQNVEKIPSRS